MAEHVGKEPVWDTTPQPPPPPPPTIKGHVDYGGKAGSGGFGSFMRAIGRGLGTVAKAGLDAVVLIGEHADDLFPGHYRDYAVFDDFNPTDDLFAQDDYLIKHVFDSKQNQDLLQQTGNGELLSSSALKQLRHTTDLVKHRAKTDAEKFAAKALETNVLKSLVGNQLMNLPRTKNNKINYNGVEIEERDAPSIVKRDLHLLFEKERRITPQEVREWPKLPPPKNAQNSSSPLFYASEPGAQDLTLETAFDVAGTAGLAKTLGRNAIRQIATKQVTNEAAKQAANRGIRFASRQLQKKYKHASKFGLPANYTPQNATAFAKIVEQHIKDPSTQHILGTYRGTIPVNAYFNPYTKRMVMTHRFGPQKDEFLSAWKLCQDQLKSLYKTRNIQ